MRVYRPTKVIVYDKPVPDNWCEAIYVRAQFDCDFAGQLRVDELFNETFGYYVQGLLTEEDMKSTSYLKATCHTFERQLENRCFFATFQYRRAVVQMATLSPKEQAGVKTAVLTDLCYVLTLIDKPANVSPRLARTFNYVRDLIKENFDREGAVHVVQEENYDDDENEKHPASEDDTTLSSSMVL